MPSVSANLSKSQKDDLIAICRPGAAKLNQIAQSLERQKPVVKRAEFRQVLAEAFGEPQASAAAVRAFPGLATAIRKFNIPEDKLFEMLTSSIQNLDEEARKQWHECGPIVRRIASSEFVLIYAKARDLAFDFDRMYARARILTDIRPVFNDLRNTIVGADLIQTLRLDYFSSEGMTRTISVAIDITDVAQLKKACEDALSKSDEVRKLVEESAKLPVELPGELSE
jgi:hypothetical protein